MMLLTNLTRGLAKTADVGEYVFLHQGGGHADRVPGVRIASFGQGHRLPALRLPLETRKTGVTKAPTSNALA